MYDRESDIYPDVARWLKFFLGERNLRAEIETFAVDKIVLSSFLQQKGFHVFFPEYQSFEIEIDVLGIIKFKERADLVFVECKLKQITLRDISQLLGYSKVAKPLHAFIISPKGLSKSVNYLLNTLHRYDVLEYLPGKKINVATWSLQRREIIASTLLPPGTI